MSSGTVLDPPTIDDTSPLRSSWSMRTAEYTWWMTKPTVSHRIRWWTSRTACGEATSNTHDAKNRSNRLPWTSSPRIANPVITSTVNMANRTR
jgi:hypothetical protein